MKIREHGIEAVRGLPGPLPPGETLLWQGAPRWTSLAWRGLHLPWWLAYFGLLIAWYAVHVAALESWVPALVDVARVCALAGVVIGVVLAYAWGVSRTTVYSITSRHLVLKLGIALPMTITLPFSHIISADVMRCADGTGNIRLELRESDRVAYFLLWPHARAWHFSRPQPLMLSLPAVDGVAQTMARALAAATSRSVVPFNATDVANPAHPGAVLA